MLFRKLPIYTGIVIALLVFSGFTGSIQALQPEQASNLKPNQSVSETTSLDLGNGTTVEMTVDGNTTSFTFEDGSLVVVSSYASNTTVEIFETVDAEVFTRMTVMSSLPTVVPFNPTEFFVDFPSEAPGVMIQDVNRSSGQEQVQTEILAMSLSGVDPIDVQVPDYFGYQQISRNGTNEELFQAVHLTNGTHSEYESYLGEVPTLSSPNGVGTTLHGTYADPEGDGGPVNLTIFDNSDPAFPIYGTFEGSTQGSRSSADSFFDVFFEVDVPTSGQQQHAMSGSLMSEGSSFSYTNISSGATYSNGIAPDAAPIADRYPPTADPTIPYGFFDVVISTEFVGFTFGQFEMMLYFDKLIINYYSSSGIYIPIVIYFITYEVVIIYEYITIIVYLEIIELITVIIIYEIIKIEVYIEYIVVIIEIIEITIIEIIIYVIDIDIIIVEIKFIINIFIINIKIVINILRIIILPIWIWIIPIPIFIPIFIPVFIPVPTPVPFVIPRTDVDLADEVLNVGQNVVDVSYWIKDEYDRPISGANVTIVVDNGSTTNTVSATEDTSTPGLYHATLPYNPKVKITVDAIPIYRPPGKLVYEQEVLLPAGSTTTVRVNSTKTTTVAGGPVPINPVYPLLALFLATTVIYRRRQK